MSQHRHYIRNDLVTHITTKTRDKGEDYNLDQSQSYSFSGVLADSNYTTSYFRLEYLKEIIHELETHDSEYVEIRGGDKKPVILTGLNESLEPESLTRGMTAPINHITSEKDLPKKFAEAQNTYGRYHVSSNEHSWGDRYQTLEKAREAASDHLYLTGSTSTIAYPSGEEETYGEENEE